MCIVQGKTPPLKQAGKYSSIEKNVATFDAKFSSVTQHPEAAAAAILAGGRSLVAGAPPSVAGQPAIVQDFTLLGSWKELWESHLHERERM